MPFFSALRMHAVVPSQGAGHVQRQMLVALKGGECGNGRDIS